MKRECGKYGLGEKFRYEVFVSGIQMGDCWVENNNNNNDNNDNLAFYSRTTYYPAVISQCLI